MTTETVTEMTRLDTIAELAAQLRVDSIRSSTSAGSGHPTSSMSAADLIAVLAARHLRYDWDDPHAAANDHLVFSKGHASPLLYSLFKAAGVVSDEELMTGYRRFGQRLEGHPTPVLPWVDVATGSLGQGLPDGVGIALSGKYLEHLPFRVWVLCGDSELAEGSIWEAIDKASYYKLSNLVVMADINRLGQRGPTDLGWDLDAYERRFEAFGARALVIDGHDLSAIDGAFAEAENTGGDRPTVIVAKTIKGRGFSEVENKEGWHGKPLPARHGRARHQGARGRAAPGRPWSAPREGRGPSDVVRDDRGHGRPPPLRPRRLGRHPQGLRRRVGRHRRRRPTRRRVGCRSEQLDPRRRVQARVPRSLLRDVHLRAAAGRRRHGIERARLQDVRLHVRRLLHPGVRLRANGRHLGCRAAPVGIALRGRDRRGRAFADGSRGPRHDAHGSRVHRLVPERRNEHGGARRGDGAQPRDQLHPHDTGRVSRDLRGARGVRDRRFEGPALLRAATTSRSWAPASRSTSA